MDHLHQPRSRTSLLMPRGTQKCNLTRMSTHTDKSQDLPPKSSAEKYRSKIPTSPTVSSKRHHKPESDPPELKKDTERVQSEKKTKASAVQTVDEKSKNDVKINVTKDQGDVKYPKGKKQIEQLPGGFKQEQVNASTCMEETLPKLNHTRIEIANEKKLVNTGVGEIPVNENYIEISQQDDIFGTPVQSSADPSLLDIQENTQEFDMDNNLPPTATLLTTKNGSKVYLIGTVHFSKESQKEVAQLVRAVQPDYLVLELCTSRAYMLQWDEEEILKEAQKLNFSVMRQVIRTSGFVQGGLYLILLSVTMQITKQLGVAPGGEFRAAFREAVKVPNCIIWFGDRPLQVTLQRMLSSLSLWQIIKLAFIVLFKEEKISKEEVEKCKDQDVLERMILGFSKELPEFSKVMMNERDAYLTYSLQLAAQRGEPNKVVGVVGIGHLAGIKENWGKVTLWEVQNILTIPPPKTSYKIMKYTLKFTAVGLVLYGIHKLACKSSFYSNLYSDQTYWNMTNALFDA